MEMVRNGKMNRRDEGKTDELNFNVNCQAKINKGDLFNVYHLDLSAKERSFGPLIINIEKREILLAKRATPRRSFDIRTVHSRYYPLP